MPEAASFTSTSPTWGWSSSMGSTTQSVRGSHKMAASVCIVPSGAIECDDRYLNGGAEVVHWLVAGQCRGNGRVHPPGVQLRKNRIRSNRVPHEDTEQDNRHREHGRIRPPAQRRRDSDHQRKGEKNKS